MTPMADQATEHVTIDAPPQRCWETALEFERYPEWAKDLKRAVVLSRDGDDRPQEVEFTAAAMGRSTKYILRYDYSRRAPAPVVVARRGRHHEGARRVVPVRAVGDPPGRDRRHL